MLTTVATIHTVMHRGRTHRIEDDCPLVDATAAHPLLWDGPEAR